MRVTSKGQVTIPIELRDRLGIHPGTDVDFGIDGDVITIAKAPTTRRGRRLVDHMRGRATSGASTDEIMALTRGE